MYKRKVLGYRFIFLGVKLQEFYVNLPTNANNIYHNECEINAVSNNNTKYLFCVVGKKFPFAYIGTISSFLA